jgi:hypothetical protein
MGSSRVTRWNQGGLRLYGILICEGVPDPSEAVGSAGGRESRTARKGQ